MHLLLEIKSLTVKMASDQAFYVLVPSQKFPKIEALPKLGFFDKSV